MKARANDVPEFTDEQLRAAIKGIGKEARQAAFTAGRAVLVAKNSRMVLLYADGTEKDVGPIKDEPVEPNG
jgi:hypothetical protein